MKGQFRTYDSELNGVSNLTDDLLLMRHGGTLFVITIFSLYFQVIDGLLSLSQLRSCIFLLFRYLFQFTTVFLFQSFELFLFLLEKGHLLSVDS